MEQTKQQVASERGTVFLVEDDGRPCWCCGDGGRCRHHSVEVAVIVVVVVVGTPVGGVFSVSQSSVDVGVVMFVRSDDGDGCDDECDDGDDSLMVWTTEPAGGRLPVVGATGKAQGGGAAVIWDAGDIGPSESDSVSPDPTPGSAKRAKTMRARFRCRGIRP